MTVEKPNGCGPSWLPRWAWPDLGLTKECNEHDEAYEAGGTIKNRFSADSAFFVNCNRRAAEAKHPLAKAGLGVVVAVNHLLVRLGGWASFKYRKKAPPPDGD